MPNDYRAVAADYYDRFAQPPPGDIEFYLARVSTGTRVLELGCGTGRVTLPLAQRARFVCGIDLSPGMLGICQRKLAGSDLPAQVRLGDVTDFDLTASQEPFDLIIATFRVMQNLETDAQVDGMMRCIKQHLAPGGTAILNVFRPRGDARELIDFWQSMDGTKEETVGEIDGDPVKLVADCRRFQQSPLIVYPNLTYRRYNGVGERIDEAAMDIAMRV